MYRIKSLIFPPIIIPVYFFYIFKIYLKFWKYFPKIFKTFIFISINYQKNYNF